MKNNIYSIAYPPAISTVSSADNTMLQLVATKMKPDGIVHFNGARPLFGDDAVEKRRLENIEQLDILDTPSEEAFDRITRLAQKMFKVPIAVVTVLDGHRSWFKSCYGLEGSEAPREHAFCNYTIREHEPLIVKDAKKDPRFRNNPFVLVENGVRFYAGVPLATRDGNNVGTFCLVDTVPREFDIEEVALLSDLARMVMDELELRMLATTDSMTGALSRRAFNEQMSRAAALSLRHHHDLSCIVWDLDHFKSINDTYGHASGDTVLLNTVKTCLSHLRDTDYIGRMGGEEFAALLPNTNRVGALDVAEKLRCAIEKLRFVFGKKETSVTASFGVVSLNPSNRDYKTMLSHADEALYEAKSAGRNQCAVWKDPKFQTIPRRRVLKAGQILFNGRTSIIDCTIRTLSEDGAGLDVSSSAMVPKKFDLAIKADEFEKPCKIVSHSEKHIEVAFC